MKNNVIISIRGQQAFEGTDEDAIELVTAGRMIPHGTDGYVLSYEESALTGLEGTRTTLRVQPNKVSMTRTGAVTSNMVFELGQKHTSLYNTPFGSMEIGISAKEIDNGLSENGGHLKIDYAIEIDHALAGRNLFDIRVRQSEKSINPQ